LLRFSVDVVRSMQIEAKGKSSRLDRTFSVSLKQLIALLLFVIVVLAVGFWAVQRVDMHRRWASQSRESQSIRGHLWQAYVLLDDNSFETDNITQNWFFDELEYAARSLHDLGRLDRGHQSQLFRIETMLWDLRGYWTYVLGLNSTERSSLAENLYNIGGKVVKAYFNYLNYTSSNYETGPPFWYFGPSPPDEKILEEAVELAIDIEENLLHACNLVKRICP
jgi:hypothetical protein